MLTFEELLQLAEGIPLPDDDDKRDVKWCDQNNVVGISRQPSGAYELFLCGEELHARLPLVSRHLKFDQWARAGGEVFQANRIVLPSDEHYLPMAAFLAEELLRRDVVQSLARGFEQTEPLIEMALRRIALGEEELLGLLGELRFLEALLSIAGSDVSRRVKALEAWKGHERGARDFLVRDRVVEVKTTRGTRSVHRISNLSQVDPRRTASGEPNEELFLLSLGFEADDSISAHGARLSLPAQVDRLLSMLPSSSMGARGEAQELLLNKIASYGVAGLGYDHDVMQSWPSYQRSWRHTFARIYDMGDPAIKVLRHIDMQGKQHVIGETVSFDVDLPERVSGDLNPHTDLFALATRLLG